MPALASIRQRRVVILKTKLHVAPIGCCDTAIGLRIAVVAALDESAQGDVGTAARKGFQPIAALDTVPEELAYHRKTTCGIQYLGRELIHHLGICHHRLLCIDLCHTHRPTGGKRKQLMVLLLVTTVTGTLNTCADTYMEYLAALDGRMIQEARHSSQGLLARKRR